MSYYELDRCQCQAVIKSTGKRCVKTATHSDGGKAYCPRCVEIARRDRANKAPIVKGKK
jgi:hypothetical protein